MLDYVTADNADHPAVIVYDVETGDEVCRFPIPEGPMAITASERLAVEFIAEASK